MTTNNGDFSVGDLGFGDDDDDFDGLIVEPEPEEPVYTVPHGKGDGNTGGGSGSNGGGAFDNIATFAEEDSICADFEDGAFPLLTTDCTDYVNCVGGKVDEILSCPQGLAFSAAFKGCQWASSVICPTAAPITPVPTTYEPTGKAPPPPPPPPKPTRKRECERGNDTNFQHSRPTDIDFPARGFDCPRPTPRRMQN